MSRLLPCPFCGGKAELTKATFADGTIRYWTVKCTECKIFGKRRVDSREAMRLWNCRAEDK